MFGSKELLSHTKIGLYISLPYLTITLVPASIIVTREFSVH